MLILKKPIKLKSLSPIIRRSDEFFERMHANYQVLWVKYDPGELFHLVSQSPEVYIGEGGMTVNIVQNQTNRKIRLEMAHNLFNRLMMAGSSRFTYQDMVYVQSMLKKIGVKNISEFMGQLHEMKEDAKNIRQLSELYERNMTVLKKAVNSIKVWDNEDAQKDKVYRLYKEIFWRLRSEEIYHMVAAFQKDAAHTYDQIKGTEVLIAEQARAVALLRFHRFQMQVIKKDYSFLSHRVNLYEEGMEEDNSRKDTILQELTAAVLLNLIGGFCQLQESEAAENPILWYRFHGDFRQTLKNTMDRFQAYHFSENSVRGRRLRRFLQKSVNAFRKQEIVWLRQVLEEEDVRKTLLEMRDKLKKQREQERIVASELAELVRRRDEIRLLARKCIPDAGGWEAGIREEGLQETEVWETTGRRARRMIGTEELQALEELNQVSRRLYDQSENRSFRSDGEKERVNALKEEVYRLNEANRQKMENVPDKKANKSADGKEKRINKERTRQETLRLLEHPELVGQYFQEQESVSQQAFHAEEALKNLPISQELKKVFAEILHSQEREFLYRILGRIGKKSESQILSREERERTAKIFHRAEAEIITRTLQREEKRARLSEEIQGLKRMIELLEETLHRRAGKEESGKWQADLQSDTVYKIKESRRKQRKAVKTYLDMVGKLRIAEKELIEESRRERLRMCLEISENFVESVETETSEKRRNRMESAEQVQLYHKSTAFFDREMAMEKIRDLAGARRDRGTAFLNGRTGTQSVRMNQQIRAQEEFTSKKSAEQINEMIQRGVRRQIESISNEVYRRLERKLSDDRKRRGY